MGTVTRLHAGTNTVTLAGAVDAFLAEIAVAGTRRAFAATLRSMVARFGPASPVDQLAGSCRCHDGRSAAAHDPRHL